MDITRIHVVAQVQPSSHLNGFAEPHLLIHHDEEEPTLTLENSNDLNYDRDLLKSKYRLSRCVSNFDYHTEIEYLVNAALDGYDAAAIFMSASTTDTFQERQEIIHRLLTDLDSRMEALNKRKEGHGQSPIKIEFAYLGITDDGCHDLRTLRPLKNSQVLELGLAAYMRSVQRANHVWDKIKLGSKFPSILGVRLSNESKLLGTLMIADLLQPWSQTDSSIRYSFKKLLDAVDTRIEDGFEGFISIETSVLTKILGPFFCGLGKSTIFIQIDEYPRESLDATLKALNLSHKLYNIRSIATPNQPDTSKHSYRKAEKEKKQLLEEKRALEKSIQDLQQGYQQEELRVQKQNQDAMNLQQQRIDQLNNQLKLALEKEEEYKKSISSGELHATEMSFLASSGEYMNFKLQRELLEYKNEAEKYDYTVTMLRIKLADMSQKLQDMQDYNKQVSAEAQSESNEKMRLLNNDVSEAKGTNDKLEKEIEKLKKEVKKQKDEVKKQKDEVKKQKEELKKQKEELKKQKDEVKKQKDEVKKKEEELKNQENELKKQETFFSEREKVLQADLDFVTEHAEKLVEENETLKTFADRCEQKNNQLKKKLAEMDRSDQFGMSDQEKRIYEDIIQQWKTRAKNAEKELGARKILEDDESQEEEAEQLRSSKIPKRISSIKAKMIDLRDGPDHEATDIREEHGIQHRVLPRRGVKKKQSYSLKEMFDNFDDLENDFEPAVLPKKANSPLNPSSKSTKKADEKQESGKTEPSKPRGRPRKQKPKDQVPSEKEPSPPAATTKEPTRDENQESSKEDHPKRSRGRPRKQPKDEMPSDKEPSPAPEDGDGQSPIMEYEVELKMPEDTPEEEEEDEHEVKKTEMAPPRKKRKLRNTKRTIDYDTEFLSPLSKVNNTLNNDS